MNSMQKWFLVVGIIVIAVVVFIVQMQMFFKH